MVLVISNKQDVTTDLVIKRLQERMIPYLRMNTETFPIETKASIDIKNMMGHGMIRTLRLQISVKDIESVWYRRPAVTDWGKSQLSDEEREFAGRESSTFLHNLWTSLNAANWVNEPFALVKAEQKAYQLRVALEHGLTIPETLFSNDYDQISEFTHRLKGKVVVKPISHGGIGKDQDKVIFSTDFEEFVHTITPESVESCPILIQERIEKSSDIRLTVFGNIAFAHRIVSSSSEGSELLDWRLYRPGEVRYTKHKIPSDLLQQVFELMQSLNIKYGAFDFALNKNGEWIFLEVNPSGQFAWLEIATGDHMIDALIDLLTSH